ncbi:oligosaccharide flippase family protein [Mesobacillus jeotgali]|uniref:Oligosaccharide flippase family protein n=1 Tax=Mesobacillus jeotgali TaxID=129985 RepID=A0ABY9VNV2_9BACI|nr:oligosaccharide flippase family protein [Mesobacillus jeotgali]WNF22666.1 oligosaccharide flippase family protein [Mesobacillus jeotgali]
MKLNSLINIFLRGLTIGSRFLLTFIIAQYISIEELGTYSLVNTSIILGVILVGFDFYMFANRVILKDKKNLNEILFNQFLFYIFIYFIILISMLFIHALLHWDLKILILFTVLLFIEHLSQELYRLFIIFGRPLTANFLLFSRSGMWGIIAIIFLVFLENARNIEFVLYCWLIGSSLSLFLSFYLFSRIYRDFQILKLSSLNFDLIKKGIKASIPFFISTIFLKIIEFFDRFIINYFLGKEQLGIYTFFYNISNILPVFVFTSVGMFLYPKAVEYFANGKIKEYQTLIKRMYKLSILSMVSLAIFATIAMKVSLIIIKDSKLVDSEPLFYLMLIQMVFIIFAQLSHYELYAQNKERKILFTTVISSVVSIFGNIILIPTIGINGATISGILSFALLFGIRKKYSKLEY